MVDENKLEDSLGAALILITYNSSKSGNPRSYDDNSIKGITQKAEESKGQVIPFNSKAKECIITLCKILDNILREKEYNAKTRSIKLSNRLFRERVGNVPGAIDFLLACNFTYMTTTSSSDKNKRHKSHKGNHNQSIQLTKDREDRIVLLIGRIYLHKFGKQVLGLDDAKNKNELPPLKKFRDITENIILQKVGDNISVLVADTMKKGQERLMNSKQNIDSQAGTSVSSEDAGVKGVNRKKSEVASGDDRKSGGPTLASGDDRESGGSAFHVWKKVEALNDELIADKKEETHQNEHNTNRCEELPPILAASNGIIDVNEGTRNERKGLDCNPVTSPSDEINASCSNSSGVFDSAHKSSMESPRDQVHMGACEDHFGISLNILADSRHKDPSNESVTNVREVNHFEVNHDLQLDPLLDSAGNLQNTESDSENESVSSFATGLTIEEKEAFDNLSRYRKISETPDIENNMILSVIDDPLIPIEKKDDNSLCWLFNKNEDNEISVNDDEASIASHGSLSIIHIKNNIVFNVGRKPKINSLTQSVLDSEEDGCNGNTLKDFGHHDFSIDNVEIPSQLSEEESGVIRLALKLFFAIFVLVSRQPSEFYSGEVNLLSFASVEYNNSDNWFPIEIYYLLWIAIIKGEHQYLALDYDSTYTALKKAALMGTNGEKSGQFYRLISGEDIRICNFISTALSSLNLLKVTNDSVKDSLHCDGKCRLGTMIRVNELTHSLYGEELVMQNFASLKKDCQEKAKNPGLKGEPILQNIRAQWHGILVKILYEKIGFELDNGTETHTISTSNPLFVWYSARLLPLHALSARLWTDLAKLLLDKRFIRYRYSSCGLIDGTKIFLMEAMMFSNICIDMNFSSQSPPGDLGYEVKEALYQSMRSFLQEEKMLFVQTTKNVDEGNRQKANAFSDALYYLGAAFGEELENYSEEIDLYNESLRLKKKFNSDHNTESIAETLISMGACYFNLGEFNDSLARYSEALCIYNTSFEGNHTNLSKILYSMGILYCEQCEFEESLTSFKKSLELSQKQGVKDCVDTICWMGRIYREKNEYNSALDCFIRARSSIESTVGKNHLRFAEILQNLGVLYDDMGRFEESLGCYQDCLRIRRSELNDDQHEDVCETLTCIANVFQRTDRNKAIQFFRSIANIRELNSLKSTRNYDLQLKAYQDLLELLKQTLKINPSDKDVQDEIVVLNMKIGYVYEKMKEYREAVAYYCKSLKIRKIKNDHQSIGSILNSLGIAHAKRGAYKKSMKCFSDSLLVRKAILGLKHPDIGETLHNIGNCAAKQRLYDKAAESYKESLEIKRLAYGNNSISTMKTLHNIGVVSEASGDIDAALSCYQDALKVRIVLLGNDHLDVAFSLHSIGKIHLRQDNFEEAAKCFKKSLLIKRKCYVAIHLSVAETTHQLATAVLKQGEVEEALDYFKLALSIFEQALGPHIDIAHVLDSLASIFETKGEHDKSHRYLERALAMKRAILGDDNVDVSDTLYLIGKVQTKSGDEDALVTFKEVLRIRKKLQGKDSLGVAAVINDVGVIQLRRGHHDIARKCFMEAIRVWKIHLDDDHVFLGETLVNLGEIEQCDGNFDGAINNLDQALRIFSSSRGSDHLSVGFVSWKLGNSYHYNGDFDEALLAYEKALSIRSFHLGEDSLLVAETLKDIGSLHFDKTDFDKAHNYLEQAMQTFTAQSPDDIATADASFLLGKVMCKMKFIDEAIQYFENALRIRREQRLGNTEDLDTANILFELGVTNEELKKYDESINFYQQSLTIRKAVLDEDDEVVANIYHNIGVVQQSMEKYQVALNSFGSALVIYQACLGDDHLSCAKTMNNIGIVYESLDDYDESMKYHQEALRVRKLHLSKDHLKVANSLDNIASVYQKQKCNDLALECLKEALRIRIARLGKDHLEVATTLFGMGIIFCDLEELDKAMDSYNASLNIRMRKIGNSSIEIAQSLHNLGGVFALKQEYEEALERWKESLKKYREAGLMDDHHMVKCNLRNIQIAAKCIRESRNDI